MSNYTITAESVIDTVIQDGQVQTTNRGNLINFLDRVHLRMLRESQWLFLRSEEQRFITQPDASNYWIGSGAPPAGCVDTTLQLTDVASIIPDYVFDLSNNRKLTQDSQSVLNTEVLRYRDGSYRSAQPRSYLHEYNVPGVLHLYPPPDNHNSYVPLPLSPICNFTSGGVLAWDRNYLVLVTVVDSIGNESLPCVTYSNVVVPANNLLTVDTPSLDIASASLVQYAFYNVYVSTGVNNPFYKQNAMPIPMGSLWTEPTTGVSNTLGPASQYNVLNSTSQLFGITVQTDGTLTATSQLGGIVPGSLFLTDSSNVVWEVGLDSMGLLTTTVAPHGPVVVGLILSDSLGNGWQFGVLTDGTLTTTNVGPAVNFQFPAPFPPSTSALTPLLGYVISFYYQMQRKRIVLSTDLLQIPYQYFDVVVAGVNYYANLYTSKADDIGIKAGAWKKEFMDGLAQMRRDLRINFRNNDVIGPDPISQYEIGTQSGYSYPVQA